MDIKNTVEEIKTSVDEKVENSGNRTEKQRDGK